MKTTIDIPDRELKDAMRFTGAKTKRAAVLADFNRRRRMAALVRHSGSFDNYRALGAFRKSETIREKLIGLHRP
jgi:hypothetical protein